MAWNEFSAANEKEVYRLLSPLIEFAGKPTSSENIVPTIGERQQPPPTKRKAKTPAANKPKQPRQPQNPNKKRKTKQLKKDSSNPEAELVTVENFI